ncbi:MAG: heavy metal-associated domain-containing protein [FCB group bacterium]|jgi:copper chaperone CopZ
MKRINFTLIALLFFTSIIITTCLFAKVTKDKTTKEVKIKTSAICETCKATIEKAVSKLYGIEKANLDLDTKYLIVSYYPDKVDVCKIRKAVNKAGYDADSQPADPKAYNKLPKCCQKDSNK